MISIAAPEIGPEETKAVNDVLNSGILAQGPIVAAFEEAFAKYCGTKYALAVNSGTAALHAALYAAGVGPGDEVITTPFSFIATINPILMVGATPVLVDIDAQTFNLDVRKVEQAVTENTKAIIPVHLYGQPCDWDELQRIADSHNLVLIEDACQAIGAEYRGKKAGALGNMGCFSLYATKNIMCGEGGVVTTDNDEFATAIKRFRQHGMTGPYEYADLGYNYRMSDLHGAIAIEQLKKVTRFTKTRQRNAEQLTKGLEGLAGLELPMIADDRTHVFHQYTIRVRDDFGMDRDAFVQALRDRGIGAGVYYPRPLHAFPHIQKYGYALGDFPEAEKAAKEVISLPVHPKVTDEEVATIIATVTEVASGK